VSLKLTAPVYELENSFYGLRLRQHGCNLGDGLADGGMTLNLRMLRLIDQGEEVEVADMTAARTCESHATF
jgi:hypothetical protein